MNFASASRHTKAVNEFLLYGADITPINKKGQAFLCLAVLSKSPETIAILLDRGAVISAQDLEGSIVFRLVADQGHRGVINLLIDHKAEAGLVDKRVQIPLHRSACLGYRAATKLLVDRWSVITTEDYNGRTARDLAEGSVYTIKALNSE